jgi:hypothetical protein
MLDELNIVTDTDPSEVTEGGATQAAMPMGATPAFGDTESPVVGEAESEEDSEYAD